MTDFAIGGEVWPGTSKLIEEMGELNQVLGKLIATGGEEVHWDGLNLRVRLQEEIADVRAAIYFFEQSNFAINERNNIIDRADEKHRLFWKWHLARG